MLRDLAEGRTSERATASKKFLVMLWSLLAFSVFTLAEIYFLAGTSWGWIPMLVSEAMLAFIVVAYVYNQTKLDSLVRVAAIGAAAATGRAIPGTGGTPPDPGSGVASPDAGEAAPTTPGE